MTISFVFDIRGIKLLRYIVELKSIFTQEYRIFALLQAEHQNDSNRNLLNHFKYETKINLSIRTCTFKIGFNAHRNNQNVKIWLKYFNHMHIPYRVSNLPFPPNLDWKFAIITTV